MPQNTWTIHNDPNSPNIGNDLNGLHIKQTSSGYELTEPNVQEPLATTDLTAPPFAFDDVNYSGQTWDISVTSLPQGSNGGGSWNTPAAGDEMTDPQSGEFTAQAGAGADADAASSAKA